MSNHAMTIRCSARQIQYLMGSLRDNVYAFPTCLFHDILAQSLCPPLDRPRGGHGGRNDLDAIGIQSFSNAPPVVDTRKEAAGQMQLVETQQTVG